MLKDAAGIRRVVIASGFVDLRKGIDGLAQIIGFRYAQNPFEKGTLFLFCGRRSDPMKGLLWMGNGFLLLYIVTYFQQILGESELLQLLDFGIRKDEIIANVEVQKYVEGARYFTMAQLERF